MNETYNGPIPDHIRDILHAAEGLAKQGATVHFKFTCAKCGARQTFADPNTFYPSGECEACKHVTDLFKPEAKVNYLVVMGLK